MGPSLLTITKSDLVAVGGKRLAPRRTREEQETAMEIASSEFLDYFQCSY
jgi:hypothetical protein